MGKDPSASPTSEDVAKFVEEQGFVGSFETSAKENQNVSEALRALVTKILENDKMLTEKGAKTTKGKGKNGVVRVGADRDAAAASSSCC